MPPVAPESNPDLLRRTLAHLPLFHALSADQLDRVAAGVKEIRLEKGDLLFRKGSPALGFHVVIFGQIKLAVNSPQGQEKVVEIIGPRQSFGEAVMFLHQAYPVNAEALADSLLIHVPRDEVDALLESDPTFARAMLAGLSVRLHSLIHDVESYSTRSSAQRVIGYLLQQCGDQQEGSLEVELPTSKLVIASRLNLTPETLSRVLSDLIRQCLIEVRGRVIRIPELRNLREYEP